MKIKYLFMSIAAIAVLAAGCTKELPGNLEELQVSKSYVSIPEAGGSDKVKITAKGNWTIVADAKATWLEISPKNGGAGETVVKFSAKNTLNTNQTTVNIKIGDKIQYINVKQQVGSGDPDVITCSQVKDQPDGKEVMLKGMCTKITESQQYGNWYIKDDTGEVLIYGTKDWAKKGIEVGDVVLVQGPKKDYKGTIELVDVKVLKIIKSIIKLDKDMVELDKEAADFTVKASFKGEVMEPVISADWLTLVGASAAEGSITYQFHATDHNVIEAPRNAEITFTAKKKTKDAEGNEEKGGYPPAPNPEPAKNVPEPDIDENAIRQKTLEGSYKALAAYEASFLYAVLTGNSEYAKKLSHEDDPNLRPQFDLYRDIYNGGGWMEGYDLKCWILDKRPMVVFESDIVAVAWNYGEKFEAYKAHLSKEEVADQPADTADNIYMVTIYDGGSWKYVTNTYLKQKYPQLVESGNSSSSRRYNYGELKKIF